MSRHVFLTPIFGLLLATLFGCAAQATGSPYGSDKVASSEADLFRPGNRYQSSVEDPFFDEVQPVVARRCVTCHGCTDSPCQLKLTSYEGMVRGSNKTNLFSHVLSVTSARLEDERVPDQSEGREGLIDYGATVDAWRGHDYYSVLDRGAESTMVQLLDAAQDNPIASRNLRSAHEVATENLRTRKFECVGETGPKRDQLAARPMPFGLPELPEDQDLALRNWIINGADRPSTAAEVRLQTPSENAPIEAWETFLNGDSPKEQLVSRFLYEHTFFAKLHFAVSPGEFYQIVRSYTGPGQSIHEIVMDTPHQRPEGRVYYRLRKYTAIIVAKSHTVIELDEGVMGRWKQLLLDPEYQVAEGAADSTSRNPFEYFEAIPSMLRARFLVESSKSLVEAMVKGDVCTGSTATYAIRDRFWVWFLDPESDPSARDPHLGLDGWNHLNPETRFSRRYQESDYREAFEDSLRRMHPDGLSLDDIWDADGGTNPNGWLTVLRHERSATAHHGAIAGRPDSLWVLSFSNLERLYYNLVVNYKPWGRATEGLATWKYMSRIRAEGEELFLSLLPETTRDELRAQWTQKFGSFGLDALAWRESRVRGDGAFSTGRATNVRFTPGDPDPMGDVIDQMWHRMGDQVTGGPDPLNNERPVPARIATFDDFEQALSAMTGWRGAHASVFPNLTLLRVHSGAETRWYTVINNRGYKNHDVALGEERARDMDQDVLSAVRGVLGSYPELFIDVPLANAGTWVAEVARVNDISTAQQQWREIVERHASPEAGVHIIQRTHPQFWSFFDSAHDYTEQVDPIGSGVLDVSEYLWVRDL